MNRIQLHVFALLLLVPTAAIPTIKLESANAMAGSTTFAELKKDFSGHWAIQEEDLPSTQNSNGNKCEGIEIWREEQGGVPFVEEFHCKVNGTDESDYAYFWNDATTKNLKGLWCAAFNDEGCSEFSIRTETERWVLEGSYTQNGSKLLWKESFTKDGEDKFTQILEMGPSMKLLKPVSVIHATRAK